MSLLKSLGLIGFDILTKSYDFIIKGFTFDSRFFKIPLTQSLANGKKYIVKFKEDLEVYIFSEYDNSETPIDDYTHITFKNNEILSFTVSPSNIC